MNVKNVLKKYRTKLTAEAIIRAAAFGAIFGFIALLGYEFAVWMAGIDVVWPGICIFAVVAGGVGALAYFLKYRPTAKAVARRIDALGLEERVITMTQFENEQDEIYVLQRNETLKTLAENGITEKLIKIVISVPCIIALCFTALFGIGMTTVSALSANGVIESGKEVISGIEENKPKEFYDIAYEVYSGEGYIEGEIFQRVEEGSNTTAVLAVPEDGYAFVYWSDKNEDPYRIDYGVTASVTYYAVFLPISETGGDGDLAVEGDEPSDLPVDYQEGANGGEENEDGEPAQGAGGVYESHNQVLDGETYYGGQVYRNAYQDAIDRMAEEQGWTDEEKEMINEYFKTIAK